MYRATKDCEGRDFKNLSDAIDYASSGDFGRIVLSDGVHMLAEWKLTVGKLTSASCWGDRGKGFHLAKGKDAEGRS